MATSRVCSIPDCGKKFYAHELCRTHYMRKYQTGRLDLALSPRGSLRAFTLAALEAPPTEGCIVWPAPPKAIYLYFIHEKVRYPAHRYVCEQTHGPAPSTDFEAAHACGNKHCLNPRHIKWKTHLDNIRDKAEHGTMQRGSQIVSSKLVEADIPVIRSGVTGNLRETAEKYGVCIQTISLIRHRKTWRHI